MYHDFFHLLDLSDDVHRPLPIDEQETAEFRLLSKPVLESRLIDDMESLDHWVTITDYMEIELSSLHYISGHHSLCLKSPTNLPDWLPGRARGRIYAEPAALRIIDRENWEDWNRLSVWVFPHIPGMKSICLRMQLHNDGEHQVPDRYEREGAHNFSLKPDTWNHVVLEMPYLHRDCVTGVSFVYDMCGHEPDAADHCIWYIDRLELQKVDCDVYEGWEPKAGEIAYSGSGFHPKQPVKQAIATGLQTDTFRIINFENGRIVLEKPIQTVKGPTAPLQLLDYSDLCQPGRYIIQAGSTTTRPFYIDRDVWLPSIWKVLNFYLSQRCGFEVPGKHRACHSDLLLKNGDQAIVANGGWHDAADLAQSLNNTADGTSALLMLSERLRSEDKRLYKRVLEEAKWGLDYTLKVRFGDGKRSVYSSTSIWTDGVIGTADDIVSTPAKLPLTSYLSAYAEANGARVFQEEDPIYAQYCLKIAAEDFAFGLDQWDPRHHHAAFQSERREPPILLDSIATAAAAALYEINKQDLYKQVAIAGANRICSCQQQTWTDWDTPMRGFFYQGPEHEIVWHHNHLSYAHYPLLALDAVCHLFPDHPDHAHWENAIRQNGAYHLAIGRYTEPYFMIPEGVYHEDEAFNHFDQALGSHPFLNDCPDDIAEQYRCQVRQGFPLGKGWYLRCFPVWFSFRGNISVQLSQGVCMQIAAHRFNSNELQSLSQHQLEWIVGKNPFTQSILYGEGYNYIQQYAVQPGQTVGQLPVGIQSKFETDLPFWPHVNTATYKEVWISSANKWIWNMVYAYRSNWDK
ncbi:MAG: glycoside hydrolase family 9 protein [Clostridia bacterium]|nr:glycoside hydrolase family 9 protein [Clostridia bacterium]